MILDFGLDFPPRDNGRGGKDEGLRGLRAEAEVEVDSSSDSICLKRVRSLAASLASSNNDLEAVIFVHSAGEMNILGGVCVCSCFIDLINLCSGNWSVANICSVSGRWPKAGVELSSELDRLDKLEVPVAPDKPLSEPDTTRFQAFSIC